ncbi:hypothetical protein AtEden1_Chr5g0118191 [Arabidopsis thaliana]
MDTKKLFGDFLSACRDLHLQDVMDMELWFLYNPRLIESPVITDVFVETSASETLWT